MGLTIKQATAKAVAAGAKQSNGGFSGVKRSSVSNSQIPANLELVVPEYTKCMEQPIRGSFKQDEEGNDIIDPMTGKKVPVMAEFIYCSTPAGDNAFALYPGSFSKGAVEYTIDNNGVITKGNFQSTTGDVAVFLDQFSSNEDAMQALVTMTLPKGQQNPNASDAVKEVVAEGQGKTIKVAYKQIYTNKFASRNKELSQMTKSDLQKANIPTWSWGADQA